MTSLVITKGNIARFGSLLNWAGKNGACGKCKATVAATLTNSTNPAEGLRLLLDGIIAECDNRDCRAHLLRIADVPRLSLVP